MTTLLTFLALASQAAPNLKFDVHSPDRLVSGLPLVVGCTVRNDGDADVYCNLGANRAGWLAAKVLDRGGHVVAQSVPDVPLPRGSRGGAFSPGPRLEPRRNREISVSLRMDTSALEAGDYTVAYDLDLPVADSGPEVLEGGGRSPAHARVHSEAPLTVVRDASAVEAQAREIVRALLASPGASNGEAVRRLMLVDRRVAMPLVAEVAPSRWTDDQVSFFLREVAPYATLEDARWLGTVVRPGVRSWAWGAFGLMRRSETPGVAEIGVDLERRLGAVQP